VFVTWCLLQPIIIIIISGTTALNRALASLTGFMMVRYVRCGVISPTINLVLVTLIRPPGTSVSKASRHLVAKQVKRGWEIWPLNFVDEHLSCSYGSLTSTTWDRRLYFPSEGRRAADFITLKIHRPRPGLNPRTLGPVASTLNTRPPRATAYFSPGINSTISLRHVSVFHSGHVWYR
jgi:hypothetical protein